MREALFIIDGHAQIYRAYYAVMGLRSPTGEPTSATFGFVNMLMKLLQMGCAPASKEADGGGGGGGVKLPYVVLAMDAGTSGRDTVDAAYKAHRKPMPEDMPPQIERILQITAVMGLPLFRAEGFEADDVMATLVRRVRRGGPEQAPCKIYMCTKDKDLDQLIDDAPPPCVMYDIQSDEEITSAALLAKKGYSPTQARDVLALTGDSADNIAGIPGVGPKTAAKWIAKYGGIDNLLAHKDEIEGKIGEALRANLSVLENSRKLVELQFDVPIGGGDGFDWDAARVHPEKLPRLAPIFRELGFTRLLGVLEQVHGQYREHVPASVTAVTGVSSTQATTAPPEKPRETPAKTKDARKAEIGGLFDQVADVEVPGKSPAATPAPKQAGVEVPAEEAAAPAVSPAGGLLPVQGDYRLVNTTETLDAMLVTLQSHLSEAQAAGKTPWLAVDTETDALGSMASRLCGISLSARVGTGFYVAVKGAMEDVLDSSLVRQRLGPLLADPAIKKVGQNLKYDLNALRNFGLAVNGVDFDTMIASYVIDSSRLSHGMDALAADYLGLKPIPISDLIGSGKSAISFADVPLRRAAHYSSEDADVTLRLAHALQPRLAQLGPETVALFHALEMPLMLVLADMEWHGVMIDTKILKSMSGVIEKRLFDLQGRIKVAAGVEFNQDSPRQLADVLFRQLKLPIVKKTKTGPSTDITVLEALADKHPVPALIVEYRQLAKLKNTYLDALSELPNPRTLRVHAHFNQTVAETGRLSSSDPNLQNIPVKTDIGREIRRAFVGAPGHVLISADYSQIELRLLAHYCGDQALIDAFAHNRDVHRMVAAELNHVPEDQVTSEMRGIAKTVNFGIIYGQTGFGLSQVLKIPQEQANAYITAYRRRFPAIEQFTHECIQQASIQGYVTTILGRRRVLPDINSPVQSRRSFSQRAALNSVIQGSAADLIKQAMVNIHQIIRDQSDDIRMLIQIHDELVFECRKESATRWAGIIRQEMEGAMKLKVPLKVDLGIGPNWVEME